MNLSLKHIGVFSKPAALRTFAALLLLVSASAFSQNVGEYKPDASTVLLLHMNESSGAAVADSSGNGNNGTATGTTIVGGRFGNARNFNGTSDKVVVSDHPSLNGITNITLEAWIYPTDTSNATGKVIARKDTGVSELYSLYQQGTQLMWVSVNTSPTTLYSTNYILPINKWSHVAVEYDSSSSEVIFYLNGKEVGKQTGVTGSIGSSSANLAIGANPTASANYFTGYIDEVRVSNVIRSANSFNLQLPPKSLLATPIGTSINLSWLNGGGAVGLLKYKVYRGTDSTTLALVDSTLSASYSDSGLSAGTTYYYRVSAIDSTGFEGAKSYAASATPVPPPTITSFTPTSGPVGTSVTITGTNFNTTPAQNKVYFGAVKANVTGANATQLTATVPVGATYAPITVTDTTTGLTAYSSKPFMVAFPSSQLIDAMSFAAKVDFTTGANPAYVVIGDVDGDGKPDPVVSNQNSNAFSVYRNTSTSGSITAASFASKVDFTTGTQAEGLAIGDLDGDGKLDLVVTNHISNTVSLFRNTSTSGSITAASFAAKIDFATGTGPYLVAIGDLDGDGKPDLVMANYNSNTVSVFQNTSTSGSITTGSFAAKVDFPTGTGPIGVALGDVDGDGKPDLAVTNYDSNTVSVYRNICTSGNITTGSFAAKVDFTAGTNPRHIAIGDLDGDGKPDVAVTNFGSNTVSVFRNTSTSGTITTGSFAVKVDFVTGTSPNDVAIGDVDGDGRPDFVVTNNVSNIVSVYRNISTSGNITTGSFATKVDFAAATDPEQVAIGDVDGDGKPDLVVTNNVSNTVSVFRNSVAPQTPQNLNALAGDAQVSLKWNKISENRFLRYRIYGGTTPNPTTKVDSTLGGSITDTTKIITGLTSGEKYYFRVTAVDSSNNESAFSNEDSAVVLPSKPQSLAATALSDTSIKLMWASGGGKVSYYKIYKNVDSTSLLFEDTTSSLEFTFAALSPATRYYFKVAAVNSEDAQGDSSNLASAVTNPTQVQNLIAISVDTTSADLSWDPIGGEGVHYRIYRGVTSSSLAFIDTTLLTSFTNGGLLPAKTYFYKVSAVNSAGVEGAQSDYDSTTTLPSQVRGLAVTALDTTSIALQWNAVSGTPLRYRVYRGTDSSAVSNVDSTTSTSIILSGLLSATKYFFRVSALNIEEGEGELSYAADSVTIPLKVRNLVASAIDTTTIGLAWNAVSGTISNYNIYRGVDSTALALVGTSPSPSFTSMSLSPAALYYYRVSAVNAAGVEGTQSYADKAVTYPSQVRNLTASTVDTTKIGLTWNDVSGLRSHFRIYRGADSTSVVQIDSTTSLSYVDSSRSSATKYFYRVSAVNTISEEGVKSFSDSAVTLPSQVRNLLAVAIDTTQISLTWNAVSGTINNYTVYQGPDSTALLSIGTTAGTSYTATGLTSATRYFFRISAFDEASQKGEQSFASTTLTKPSQVKNLTASTIDTTKIGLTWNDVSGLRSHFRIYRGADSTSVVQIDSTTSLSYVDSSRPPATKYFYRISAVNTITEEGVKSFSDSAVTLPSQVRNVAATAIDTAQISLTWNDVSGTISNYTIYRGTDSTTLSSTGTTSGTSYTATGLTSATRYYFRVSAFNEASQEGERSFASTTLTKPSQVKNLTASTIDTTTIGLAWDDVGGLRSHFRIYRGSDSTLLAFLDTTSSASYTNAGLPTATKYFYRVSAVNTISEEGVKSYADSAVTLPSRVRNLASSAIDTTQISLTWNAVSGTINSYTIYRGSDTLSMTPIGSTASTSSVVTGLTSATRYFFRISAFNEASQEGEASSASTTVTKPSQVRNLTASTIDTTEIGLTWNDVSGLRSHFRIYRGSDSTSLALIDTTSLTSYTNVGLPTATKYFYRVSAVNTISEEGVKSFSDSAVTLPSQVRTLSAVAIDTTQISLTWNAVSGTINQYTIYRGTDSTVLSSIGTTSGTSYTATGLTSATRYFFRISAFNEASQEGEKSFASTTVTRPSQVRNLISSSIDTTKIGLTWNDVSGLRSHFRIYRGADSTTLAFIDSTWSTSYTNVGLPTATKYFYRVSAVDTISQEGVKSFADSAVTVPSQVRNLASSAIDTAQISLTWSAVSGTINQYTIYRGTDSTVLSSIGTTSGTSYTATGLTSATRYFFRISAFNEASQEGEKSFASTTVTRPSQVRNLTASTIDTTEIGLTWNDVSGLRSHFRIYRGSDSTSLAFIDSTWSTSYTNVGLPTATKYFYRVSAVDTIAEEGVKSFADSAITLPSWVRNLASSAIDTTQISLTWNAASGTINNYTIYRGSDSLSMTPIGSTASTSSVVTGLSAATRYFFRISAFNEASQEGEKSFASTTVTRPSQVRNLTASTIDTTKIGLTWNDVNGLRSHFRIYRGADSTSVVQIDSTTSLSYVDSSRLTATKYFYRVSAVNTISEEGVKSFSDSAVTIPSQVRNLASSAIDTTQISLTWNAVSGTINNYTIYRGSDSLSMTPIGSTASTSSVVTGLTAATRYFFRISAFNEANQEGQNSSSSTTVTKPSQVRNLIASTIDTTEIGLTWNDVSGLRSHFNIYRGSDSTSLTLIDTTSSTSYTNIGLPTATKYFYQVSAINTISEEGVKSFSDSAVTLPSQVRNLAAIAIDTAQISLTWNAVSGTISNYTIYQGTDSLSMTPIGSTSSNSSVVTGLSAATRYFFRMSAFNEASQEGEKSFASTTVTRPSQVRSLTTSTIDTTKLGLTWNDVSGLRSYFNIYRGADSTSLVLVDTTSATTYINAGLPTATKYYYRVSAVNTISEEGVKSFSDSAVTLPSQVRSLAASAIDSAQISLTWNAVSGTINNYTIYQGADSTTMTPIGSTASTSSVVTGLTAATRYFFRISAFNEASQEGERSFASTTVTRPSQVRSLIASTTDTTTIGLTWNDVSGLRSHFSIYRGSDSTSLTLIDTTSSTSYMNVGLLTATKFFYRVSAVNTISEEGVKSFSDSAVTPPSEVRELSTVAIDTNRIAITWNAVPGSPLRYRIYRGADSTSLIQVDSTTATSFTDFNLFPATSYYYRVAALNEVSAEGLRSASALGVTLPSQARGLIVTTLDTTSIALSWNAVSVTPARYRIYQGSDSISMALVDSTVSINYTRINLVSSTRYFFRISAVNIIGNEGVQSDAKTDVTVPSQVQNFAASPIDTSRIFLSWNAVPGSPAGYRIYRGIDSSSVIIIDSAIGNSYTSTGLDPSTRYFYKVSAVNEITVVGIASFANSTVTHAANPLNVVATTLDTNRITTTWLPGRNGAAYYRVYRGSDSSSTSFIDTTSSTSFTHAGLTPSTHYFFRISAVNSISNEGALSYAANAVTNPAQPINLFAGSLDTTRIQLTWQSGGGTNSLYRVYRSTDSIVFALTDSAIGVPTIESSLTPSTKYYYKISAVNSVGVEGEKSPVAADVTRPTTPLNLVAATINSATIRLTWLTGGYPVTRYVVYRGPDSMSVVGHDSTTLLLYDDTLGLVPGAEYFYRVAAVNSVGAQSTLSYSANAFTTLPQIDSLVAVAMDTMKVRLTWKQVAGTNVKYRVYRGADSTATVLVDSVIDAGTYFDFNPPPSARLYYRVAGVSGGIEGPRSFSVMVVTKPSTPMNVVAQALDTARIQVTWNNGGGPINTYYVYRGTTPGALVRIDSTIATSYTDSMGLTPSTRYYYQISATNIIDVEGARSALEFDVLEPAAPYLISTVTIDTSQILITWIGGTGGAPRYRIYRSLDSLNWFLIDSTIGLNYTDINLLPGTRYYYRIVAVNELGRGGMYSNSSSAVTNPSSVKNLVATALDTSRIALSWTPNGTQDKYYRIFGGTDTAALSLIDSTLALTDTLSGLFPSTRYYYQVSVVNTVGVEGIKSVVVSAVTYPVPPRNLTAATVDSNTVYLAWDASPQAAHYRIYSSMDTGSVFSFFDTTSAITYQARNLTPSTRYNFEVAAVNALAAESQKCLPASAVTKPAKPKNLTASSLDTSRVQLTWISGGGANAKYDIYRSISDTIFALIDSTTATSYTSLLLSPSVRYYFKVSAFNSIGVEGPQSASTTDVTFPSTPRNLAAYGINQTTIRLTWQNGGGAVSHYRIYSGLDSLSLTLLSDSILTTTYDNPGLPLNAVRAYKVSAVNFVGYEGTRSSLAITSPVLFGEYLTDANTALLMHLNESSGSTAFDASGNDNNGVVSGTTMVNGKFGKGRNISIEGEHITVPNSSSLSFDTSGFSVECWAKTSGTAVDDGAFFHKRGYDAFGTGWSFYVHSTGKLGVSIFGAQSASLQGIGSINDGRWHHVAAIVNPTNIRIFIDGVADASMNFSSGNLNNDGELSLASLAFRGLIDEVRISNVARSPNQFDLQLPPVFLSANDSLLNAKLQWQNGGGGVGLLRYKIYRGLDSVTVALIDSTASTSYLNTGLAKGTRYFYRVTAVDSTGFEGAKSYAKFARTQASQIATVLDSVSGEQLANVGLSFHLAGIVADTLVIKGWYAFQGDTTFRRATLQRSPARLVTRDNVDLWMSLTDIAGRDTTVQFYLTIDAPDTSATSNTITIRADMNQTPTSMVDDILTPKAADIVLTYHLFDGEKDILSIIPQFSTNGGVTWRSPAQIIGQVTNIDSAKYNATFVWKSKLDVDTSAYVRFRVIPLDRDTGTATPQSIDFEVINNSIATIQFAPVLPLKSGDIDINYVLTNRVGTLMSLKPEYSLDGGATFRPITKFVGDTSDIPLSKYTAMFTWKSHLELPNIDTPLVAVRMTPSNVLGPGIADTTEIFILDNRAPSFAGPDSALADSAQATIFWKAASDRHGPITYFIYQSTTLGSGSVLVDSVIGSTSRTTTGLTNFTRYYFRVFAQDVVGNRDSNKVELNVLPSTAPSLEFVQVAVPPIGIVSNDVTVQYRILGAALDTVQLGVSYSPDNGRNWVPTTSIKENISRLIPNVPRDSVHWRSRSDLPFFESDSMLVRFVPIGRGRKGAALSSSLFKLDNHPPAFGGVQAVIDDTSGNTLNVRWLRASDTHGPIRYFVYVSTVNNAKLFDTARAITQSDTGITVQGLTNFVKYYIAVRSMDAIGNLDTNTVVLPGTPTRTLQIDTLIAPRGRMRDSIYFRYSITAAPEDTIQLLAEYSANAGSTWKQANGIRQRSTNITAANFSDSLLWITTVDSSKMESLAMRLRVTPVGRAATGLKKMSGLFEVDTKEPQFSGRQFVFKNNMDSVFGRMQFGWKSADDLSEPVTYMVFKSETSGVYNKSTLFATTTSTAVTFSGLQSNTLYYLKLWAIDSLGNINSTYADTSKMTSLLCDYNDDGRVDSRDLPSFVNGWRTKNANIADIGPVIGTIPKVSAAQDGKIDIEDLTIFIRMWNWAFDHNKGAFSFAQSLPKSYADSAVRAGEVRFPDESIIQPGETKSVALSIHGFRDFSVVMLTMKYDAADVRIDSVALGKVFGQSSAKPLIFERMDEKRGLMHIAMAAFEGVQLDAKSVQQCLQVYVSPLKRVRDEKIRGEYELYAPDGTLIQFGNVVVTISDRPKIPLTFAMSQNYPNPFNPSTTIDYQLPVACNVTLKIFNIIGQEVATLINQEMSAGYYGVRWSTSMASGVYFYVINASSLIDDKQKFSSVKKMMLLH